MRFLPKLFFLLFLIPATGFSQVNGCQTHRIADWPTVSILDILNAPPCEREVPILGTLHHIQGGTFIQGTAADPCLGPDEVPFTHTLTRDFLAMETEISRQMWEDLQALRPNLPDDPSGLTVSITLNHPVQFVSWAETLLFANLYSVEHGLEPCYYTDDTQSTPITPSNYLDGNYYCDFDADGFRLPTEGEWEYMTRAGTTGPFSIEEPNFSNETCSSNCIQGTFSTLETVAFICDNSPLGPWAVGSISPNPWGIKDVHGNVWEWCWDWSDTYPTSPQTNYTGPSSGTFRIHRGGNWAESAQFARSADRTRSTPAARVTTLGFRLVRTYPMP